MRTSSDNLVHRVDLLISDDARTHATGVYALADIDDVLLSAVHKINNLPTRPEELPFNHWVQGGGKRAFVARKLVDHPTHLYVILTAPEANGSTPVSRLTPGR